jgi:hypothetical protein
VERYNFFEKVFARLFHTAVSYQARRAPAFKSTPSSNNCNACGASRILPLGAPALWGQ